LHVDMQRIMTFLILLIFSGVKLTIHRSMSSIKTLDDFIQQVVNNQVLVVEVDIINDENTDTMQPTSLVNHSDSSHEASNSCAAQPTSER